MNFLIDNKGNMTIKYTRIVFMTKNIRYRYLQETIDKIIKLKPKTKNIINREYRFKLLNSEFVKLNFRKNKIRTFGNPFMILFSFNDITRILREDIDNDEIMTEIVRTLIRSAYNLKIGDNIVKTIDRHILSEITYQLRNTTFHLILKNVQDTCNRIYDSTITSIAKSLHHNYEDYVNVIYNNIEHVVETSHERLCNYCEDVKMIAIFVYILRNYATINSKKDILALLAIKNKKFNRLLNSITDENYDYLKVNVCDFIDSEFSD